MQNARIDLPTSAGFKPVGPGMEQDAVIALVPVGQALTDLILRRARLKSHERMRKQIVLLVVLRRKVISFRLAFLACGLRDRVVLVKVMRNGSKIVKKLAEQVPAALAAHHVCTQQQVARAFNRLFQRKCPLPART